VFRFSPMFAVLACASPAWADAIDGDWCDDMGDHVLIVGPQISTPTGKVVQGQYRRHAFAYRVPAGEPDAGKSVYMQLQNEDNMTSYVIESDTPGPAHSWTRCAVKPKTS
jgi:hypothetical protein